MLSHTYSVAIWFSITQLAKGYELSNMPKTRCHWVSNQLKILSFMIRMNNFDSVLWQKLDMLITALTKIQKEDISQYCYPKRKLSDFVFMCLQKASKDFGELDWQRAESQLTVIIKAILVQRRSLNPSIKGLWIILYYLWMNNVCARQKQKIKEKALSYTEKQHSLFIKQHSKGLNKLRSLNVDIDHQLYENSVFVLEDMYMERSAALRYPKNEHILVRYYCSIEQHVFYLQLTLKESPVLVTLDEEKMIFWIIENVKTGEYFDGCQYVTELSSDYLEYFIECPKATNNEIRLKLALS